MSNELKLENYISGKLFQEGLNNTLLKEPGSELERTFLVLFSSAENKILASSKELTIEDIFFTPNENKSGGVLTVNKIKAENTKNYVLDGFPATADGFAIIRADGVTETTTEGVSVSFPNFNEPYEIFIRGRLSNTPVISGSTKFTFNATKIDFGV